ncbi:MAG TPA: response regulator transcription factor [Gemmatimonadaceae bacterium]|nr:response regulator transcription factor [Gemmatimonadaceae bacterium]
MTRIAIVASSEKLRSSLAAALRASDDFEVVGVSASSATVPPSADIILVARGSEPSPPGRQATRGETAVGAPLSNREREILALLADGLVNKQIAARLGISTNTVKTHLELLFDKLGVATRAEAVATGVKRGLLLL